MKHTLRILVAALSMSLVMSIPVIAVSKEETVNNAYLYLGEAMDEWTSPPALHVSSSYRGGVLNFWDNSVTYDDTPVIVAYADQKDSADSLDRARTMGDALLQMQEKDPIGDGRLRNAYGPEHLFDANDVPNIQTWGSASGNQVWTGMVLAYLVHVTKDTKYRNGALRIGEQLLRETKDTRGRGGLAGGYRSDGTKIEWKSTEHNINMVGLFGVLHQLIKDHKWRRVRKHAHKFVKSMQDKEEGRFRIGTKPDGVTISRDEYIPKNVQSWSYLAFRSGHYRQALDWNIAHLGVTDNSNPSQPVVGVWFALQINPGYEYKNDNTVWLEGTTHMALVLRVSGKKKHKKRAKVYLDNIHKEQLSGPNTDGKGIQVNSREDFSDGDDRNHTSLHAGTTAWYIMARQELSPFHLAKN